ncbi:MAG TPA: CDGSH iron-sulfur domain-containing protein [Sphingomonadales bacterium]|nr:CDGSH iron-sulfur domain-containing protein [Sphingomonadales bacterium]
MDQPLIPQTSPIVVAVKAGQTYWWCACGRSQTQPFCDGSHKGTGFSPLKVEAAADERVFFCACKRSGEKPYCDGTHKSLRGKPA